MKPPGKKGFTTPSRSPRSAPIPNPKSTPPRRRGFFHSLSAGEGIHHIIRLFLRRSLAFVLGGGSVRRPAFRPIMQGQEGGDQRSALVGEAIALGREFDDPSLAQLVQPRVQ